MSQITLPDGTLIIKSYLCITILGPENQSIKISPIPLWNFNYSSKLHEFSGKSGELSKLSKEKDYLGNEKWQDRHIALSRGNLSYFKVSSDHKPLHTIPLLGAVVELKSAGDRMLKDAFENHGIKNTDFINPLIEDYDGVLSRHCISLRTFVNQNNSSILSRGEFTGMSRTFYFHSNNPKLMKSWLKSISDDIEVVEMCMTIEIFMHYVISVGGSIANCNFTDVLNKLYSS